MTFPELAQILGFAGALLMPLCNIPLILNIIKRKSSNDISLPWAFGVELCVLAMLPSSPSSADPVLKIFGLTNAIFFSIVTFVVWRYHNR
jgi:uncharacterized protein with PQ loop repeat